MKRRRSKRSNYGKLRSSSVRSRFAQLAKRYGGKIPKGTKLLGSGR